MSADRITLKVFRFNPETDGQPRYDTFELPHEKHMTVLRAVQLAAELGDGSLAFRDCNCRRGVCGLCAMVANGKRVLSCITPVSDGMVLEPLPDREVIRDLVVQMS